VSEVGGLPASRRRAGASIDEDDLVRHVHEVGSRPGYVHIGEHHRGYPGPGHLDLVGPITFESLSPAVVAAGLTHRLTIWRNVRDDGADVAGRGRTYRTPGISEES
jgi:D-psicose/D-tagatose/L-ribulose 3-epimerase